LVAGAASAVNATVTVSNGVLDCTILDTVRVYDSEAEDVVGEEGYFAIQVQVLQHVNVTSNHSFWLEEVTSLVETGFEIQTGGRTQFRNLLQEHPLFLTVYTIDVRESLAAPQNPPTDLPTVQPSNRPSRAPSDSPTPNPTAFPTTSTPTKAPTMTPVTSLPSREPTSFPSSIPSLFPTKDPSSPPSSLPSSSPSSSFSLSPTRSPTPAPSVSPSLSPSPRPQPQPAINTERIEDDASNDPNEDPLTVSPLKGNISQNQEPAVIAAIVGGVAIVAVSCIFMLCCWCRRKDDPYPRKTLRNDTLPSHIVPGIVEFDDDHHSLAASTLGDQTAGRKTPKKKNQTIHPLGSFDENSLYTTPFSLQLEEGSTYPPMAVQSNVSSIVRSLEYHESILFPMSDTNTDSSSDGRYSFGPVSVDAGPIDLDTLAPYDDPDSMEDGMSSQHEYDELKAQQVSQAMEDGDSDLNPYEIDEWSFGDFDRIYDDEALSSQSSASKNTTKVKNKAAILRNFRAPEDESERFFVSEEEEKREIEIAIADDGLSVESFGKVGGEIGTAAKMSSNTSEDLVTDTESLDLSLSPSSQSSIKSASSKRSSSSWSSRGSRSSQPPRHPNSENRFGKTHTSPFKSPLMRLLENEGMASTPPQNRHFIPTVTPECDEEESDMEESADAAEVSSTIKTENGILGVQQRDDVSASSGSTGMSQNPWLFDSVEQALGPRSVTADMESLSGRSDLSGKSPKSVRSRSVTGAESVASYGSRLSYSSGVSLTPRTLEHDLRRLGMQLAALENLDSDQMTASSITTSSVGLTLSSVSSRHRPPKISHKKRMIVVVPPGKLGVILANRHDGKGTVISEVREHSSLKGMLSPGDKLVAVDDDDVTGMVVSQITSLMASKAEKERRLTVITTVSQQHTTKKFSQESKSDRSSRR
jgi:hypothetical protein